VRENRKRDELPFWRCIRFSSVALRKPSKSPAIEKKANGGGEIVESLSKKLKSRAGISVLHDYQVIDKIRWYRRLTTTTQVCCEEHEDTLYVRLKFKTYQGSGTTGKTTKAFAWPVRSKDYPVEIGTIMGKIIDACSAGAAVNDPRGAIGKFFDKLFGNKFVNEIDELATHSNFGKLHKLSAIINEDKHGLVVLLRHDVKKGGYMSLSLPMATIKAIHAWVESCKPSR